MRRCGKTCIQNVLMSSRPNWYCGKMLLKVLDVRGSSWGQLTAGERVQGTRAEMLGGGEVQVVW